MADLYMHLMNGLPAQFYPKEQKIFTGLKVVTRFATSLRQLRREQDIARKADELDGLRGIRYRYVRVRLGKTASLNNEGESK